MESEEGQRWLAAGKTSVFVKELGEIARAYWDQTRVELDAACRDADLVVSGLMIEEGADVLAEHWGVPLVLLHQAPYLRDSAYPHPLVTTKQLPAPLRSATGALFERAWWGAARVTVAPWRAELGLPKVSTSAQRRHRERGGLTLQAYDSELVPRMRSTETEPLVGFLTLDEQLRASLGEAGIDPALDAWLDDGEPPVFFGFGSMPVRDPSAAVTTITEVARRVGVRALVSAGWGGLAALEPDDPDVTVVGALDHDAVLPRCRAAVHHGGAGTVAASLGAGLPTVVCSVFADQPFWGTRILALGVGAHLRFADFSADALEPAIRTSIAKDTRERAGQLGKRLSFARGAAARAADAIEARAS